MKKIKQSSVAGFFYPSDANELKSLLKEFQSENKSSCKISSRAVIVPHAGLIYSGKLAYKGINILDKNIKNIFIFAPAHRFGFKGIALCEHNFWQTPLGEIEINTQINTELEKHFSARFIDAAFTDEHSIEIQIPLIQSLFKKVKIIPVLIGEQNPDVISKIIDFYYPDCENGFIISSDLSHFLNNDDAQKIDNKTAQMIESNDYKNINPIQACGIEGIWGLLKFAQNNHYSLIRAGLMNSSSLTDDKSRVVGYGCWFLFEGLKNHFLKKYYSDFIKDLCKTAIVSVLQNKDVKIEYDEVFNQLGASFVTIEKNGNLRGCIGSIVAHTTLIDDLISNAKNAAFNDSRFNPVKKDEINELEIAISILSEPKEIIFSDENDLLDKITPFVDGIIIKEGKHQAVYLPSVWEMLPNKREFLNSLKLKAGLKQDYFSRTFKAYKFNTTYIK